MFFDSLLSFAQPDSRGRLSLRNSSTEEGREAMAAVCANCGIEVDDTDVACPECGDENNLSLRPGSGKTERFAAAFAYFTFIPAIIFLFWARFKADGFVRFHSFQSIFVTITAALLAGALRLLFVTFSFISFLAAALIVTLVCLACFVLWIVLLVKALQGRQFKLPWIGKLAKSQAGA